MTEGIKIMNDFKKEAWTLNLNPSNLTLSIRSKSKEWEKKKANFREILLLMQGTLCRISWGRELMQIVISQKNLWVTDHLY